ncbi:hypothetical protein H5410_021656 [Solanum commersonii]|uniref:Uncharacterized protein n=1 Tax=Solanum commersonii TaxID=4109 RepID=A0A9J5ZEK5_SOLCO|nr:hypothetical protein H5410_021656 [Solanum commersonii]
MQRFWGVEQKNKYENFKSRPVVPGRVGTKWVEKDSVKAILEMVKQTKISIESTSLLLQDTGELKIHTLAVEHGLKILHDVVEKVFAFRRTQVQLRAVEGFER